MSKARQTIRKSFTAKGIPASPGVAVGKVQFLQDLYPPVEEKRLQAKGVSAEIERFHSALEAAKQEILALQSATKADLGDKEAKIFDVQLLVLEDPLILDRTVEGIKNERRNAEFLFSRFLGEGAERLESSSDAFFSERAVDLYDVKRRVLQHLASVQPRPNPRRPGVLLGREITPSDAVLLDPQRILGFVSDLGGVTSHASIMARARGIPAVVGMRSLCDRIQDGDVLALDGTTGEVRVNPTEEDLKHIRRRRQSFNRWQRGRVREAGAEARTQDGRRILISANMELPEELEFIKTHGAEGIGLFRTEFFFMRHHRTPSEEEQYAVYRELAESLEENQLIIRTLDVGGDKFAAYLGLAKERNPYLGMRGIRYLLGHETVFRSQLRALLRAGSKHSISILLPMVQSIDEFERARTILDEVGRELSGAGVEHDPSPRLGMMVEVPSAVVQIYDFAQHADFFSIGSNDLIQYMLAIDRDHDALSDLYDPLHPAVLRVIDWVVRASRRTGKPVSMCGEMASDPRSVPLLIGMGMKHLSVSPFFLPELKAIVRGLRYDTCLALAQEAKALERSRDVESLVRRTLGSGYSEWLAWSEKDGENHRGTPHA